MASACNPTSTRSEKLPISTAEQLTPRSGNQKYRHPNDSSKICHKMCFIPVIKKAYPRKDEPMITCINFGEMDQTQAFYEALYEAHKQSGDERHAPNAYQKKPIPKKFYDNDRFGIKPLVFIVLHKGAPKSTSEFFLAHFNTAEEAAAYTKRIWEVHKTFLEVFRIQIREPYEHGQPDVSTSSSEPPLPPSAWLLPETAPAQASSLASLLPPSAHQPTVYSSSSVHVSQPASAAPAQRVLADSKGSSKLFSAALVHASSSASLLPPSAHQPIVYSSSSVHVSQPVVPLAKKIPTSSAHASPAAPHHSWASQPPAGLLDLSLPSSTSVPPAVVASEHYPATLLPLTDSQFPLAASHPNTPSSTLAPTAIAVHASPAAFQSVSAAPEASSAGSYEEVIGYQTKIVSKDHNWKTVLECWKKGSKEPPLPDGCNETTIWSNPDDECIRRITTIPTIVERVLEDLGEGVVNVEQSWPSDLEIAPRLPIGCIEDSLPTPILDRMVKRCTCVRAPSS